MLKKRSRLSILKSHQWSRIDSIFKRNRIGKSLVSQVSNWQQIFNIFTSSLKDRKSRQIYQRVFCCGVFALLWWMNWKLLLSTTVGIGSMSLCYLAQNYHWQRYCQQWRSFFVGSNRQLAIAVGAGASGAFCTYLAASVWADAENSWLATGSILQGFISLVTLALLLWSLRSRTNSQETKLDRLLADLSHGDRLKRLVAIRQLTRLLVTNRLPSDHYYQTVEYFQVMLSEPQPPTIKNALLESLELLGRDRTPKTPIEIPLQLHRRKSVLNIVRD